MICRLCVLVSLAAFVAGAIVFPTVRGDVPVAGAATGPELGCRADVLALNFRGTGKSEPVSEPGRAQFTTDLYSLATGEKGGTATHNSSSPSVVMDHVMTFRLPDGDLVAHSTESVAPDPQHSGLFLIGIHQDNNIVPDKGTGVCAGRTGKVTMSGWHDGNKLPEQASFNDFYLIEFAPES